LIVKPVAVDLGDLDPVVETEMLPDSLIQQFSTLRLEQLQFKANQNNF